MSLPLYDKISCLKATDVGARSMPWQGFHHTNIFCFLETCHHNNLIWWLLFCMHNLETITCYSSTRGILVPYLITRRKVLQLNRLASIYTLYNISLRKQHLWHSFSEKANKWMSCSLYKHMNKYVWDSNFLHEDLIVRDVEHQYQGSLSLTQIS